MPGPFFPIICKRILSKICSTRLMFLLPGQNRQIEKVRTYSGGRGLLLIDRRTVTEIEPEESENNVENSL